MRSGSGIVAAVLAIAALASGRAQPLPGTDPLEWPEADLSGRMMDGAHAFVERKIAEAAPARASRWRRDFSSPEAYAASVEPNRGRLRVLLGVVDPRPAPVMERHGDDLSPVRVAETPRYVVEQVRWPVLEGLWWSGLLVQPAGSPPVARVIVIPDAGEDPEQLLGLAPGRPPAGQLARRLAEHGCEVLIPQTVRRDLMETGDAALRRTDQTYREWIYRQAFHLGRHVIGYEVQAVLAGVDWFLARPGAGARVGVAGHAEGALTAFHAAAVDPRIGAALVSGYFDRREEVWAEPIYRNVWSRLREFGDAEVAGLILPRGLVLEHAPGPAVSGHKGDWATPDPARVRVEAGRIVTGGILPRPALVFAPSAFGDEAVAAFARALGIAPPPPAAPADLRPQPARKERHARLVAGIEEHVQRLVRGSERVRDAAFLHTVLPELAGGRWSTEPRHPTLDPATFLAALPRYRERFHAEAMGRFDEPRLPPRPRSRLVAEAPRWTAHDVVLDVHPELFAWGLLVRPRDLRPGERRPVVVVQHGRNGVPRNLLDADLSGYRKILAVLAERGFIAFAPHNLYRGEDRYRWLSRKANTVGASLFSFIIPQHDQILRWLRDQPFVDGSRIAFYGLSYGGETAMRVPTVLEGYCLSICSGDFNQWTRKVASTEEPFSFMRTIEWEMPYWNLGPTFDYAEMAYLMLPRPFMVERGHHDRVGRDSWVAHEYAKVRFLYAQFGWEDRTGIEFFQGGHSLRAEGTLAFLHRHLRWPPPAP